MKIDKFTFVRFINKSDFAFDKINSTDNEDELKKIVKETAPFILKLEKEDQDIFKFNCFKLKYIELRKDYLDKDNEEISIGFFGVCYYDINKDGKKLYKQNIYDFDNMKITNNMIKIIICK